MTADTTQTAKAMVALAEQTAPLYDAADGVKADLQRRGWSPTAAEQVAMTWLQEALRMMFRQAGAMT